MDGHSDYDMSRILNKINFSYDKFPNVILANNATLAGHVQVHENAILGGNSAVHQYVKIGKYAILTLGLFSIVLLIAISISITRFQTINSSTKP